MPTWDVFHSDQLQVERDLTTAQVRALLAQGRARPDDLVRPAGTNDAWKRLGDTAALTEPGPDLPAAPPSKPTVVAREIPTAVLLDDLGNVPPPELGADPALRSIPAEDRARQREEVQAVAAGAGGKKPAKDGDSEVALPVAPPEEPEPEFDPLAEDAEAADFTFASRGGVEKEEDLDLAAMVDVAFQLILFFLVTASTVFFKSVEIPPPDPEKAKQGVQAASTSLQDLENDHIIVEVDGRGDILVDHEPVAAENLASKMRSIREATGRTRMLLTSDKTTPHKYVVRALDAANEIHMEIKLGRMTDAE